MRLLPILLSLAIAPTALTFDPEPVKPALIVQPTTERHPPKAAPLKAPVYDEAADAKAQIAAALVKAKKENRRVLIQWGGNWCPWCIRMAELMKSDSQIARTLMYEYDVVHVDTGQPKGKNIDLANSYGATVEKDGFPFLTVLDADGKAVINQETSSLEVKNDKGESTGVAAGHDPKKLLAFLKTNAAKPLEAQKVLDAGIAQAKSSGKVVFLHFGAPWCPWCHRLDDWMDKPEPAALLGKAFVNLKIDTDRMTGGPDILKKYRPGADEGIPWFVFIDGEGKPIANSSGPKGNVGFPAAAEELEHFAGMLAKTTLSEADRAKLIETLKADKPAAAGAAAH